MRKIWELIIISALSLAFVFTNCPNIVECQSTYNLLYSYFDINNNQFGLQYNFVPGFQNWSGPLSIWPGLSPAISNSAPALWSLPFNETQTLDFGTQSWSLSPGPSIFNNYRSWAPEPFAFNNYLSWSPVSYTPSFSYSSPWSSMFNNNYSNSYHNLWSYVPYKKPLPTTTNDEDCCSPEQKAAGYKCMRDCGPPVVSNEDPISITYSCLSPEQVEAREIYGCPICLSAHTMISTPNGEISVEDLKVGMLVWSIDTNGRKILQPVLQVSSSLVSIDHKVVHLILEDGRALWVSPKHPTTDGRYVEELQVGNSYDGSIIKSTFLEQYSEEKTYDILPAGETGHYWANGILMGSTLKN